MQFIKSYLRFTINQVTLGTINIWLQKTGKMGIGLDSAPCDVFRPSSPSNRGPASGTRPPGRAPRRLRAGRTLAL